MWCHHRQVPTSYLKPKDKHQVQIFLWRLRTRLSRPNDFCIRRRWTYRWFKHKYKPMGATQHAITQETTMQLGLVPYRCQISQVLQCQCKKITSLLNYLHNRFKGRFLFWSQTQLLNPFFDRFFFGNSPNMHKSLALTSPPTIVPTYKIIKP